MTLLDLAERVEAATGPDRDLDHDIVAHLHQQIDQRDLTARKWARRFWEVDEDGDMDPIKFTASLDAAMTLAVQGISAADVLRKAIERCTRYGAPTFIEALPRFVTAEWLRAQAAAMTPDIQETAR